MRTIYLVNGQNDMMYEDFRWWNIQAFASKEDAERFIIEKNEEYNEDMKRFNELDDKGYKSDLTDEEYAEYRRIRDKWRRIVDRHDPETEWYIAEIQFQE